MKFKLGLLAAAVSVALSGCGSDGTNGVDASQSTISLTQTARSASQGFGVSAAEIVAFDKTNEKVFVVNANNGLVDVFAVEDMSLTGSIDLAAMLLANGDVTDANLVGAANSITVHGDLAAVAVEAATKTDNGWVLFLNVADLTYAEAVQVGALPDMVTFTPDGSKVIVANEGEPSSDYSVDPEGSVSIITVADYSVETVGFTDFNVGGTRHSELSTSNTVIDGYNATVAQSFEPEYIATNSAGTEAYVALQENNAIAVIDLEDNTVDRIFGLGFKDHSIPGNELDASQKDGVNIKNWPVMGMYMPDSIASMEFDGKTYVITANEGDDRQDWLDNVTNQASCEASGYFFDAKDNCVDAFTAKDYQDDGGTETDVDLSDDNVILVDSEGNPFAATNGGFGEDNELRRLKFSYHTTYKMNGNSTEFTKLYAYGGRSFSIYDAETGEQVFDSGDFFETHTAELYGDKFNSSNDESFGDDRSDNKGPEPEGLAVGEVDGKTYAFVGLERIGGIMVYNISNPFSPEFVEYVNNRDVDVEFSADEGDAIDEGVPFVADATDYVDVGLGDIDLGPEGFKFVSASDSPSGKPLLIVGSEVSGTTTVYTIETHTFN